MIKIAIKDSTLREAFNNLDKYAAHVREGLKKEVVRTAYAIDAQAKSNAPVDTGRLRGSIHPEFSKGSLNVSIPINGAVVGTNVEYSRLIEEGFNGTQVVKAHPRHVSKVFGNTLAGGIVQFVKSHTRKVNRKAHPYLRPAANSEFPKFIANIKKMLQ